MSYVTGIDPGLTSGVAIGFYTEDRALHIDSATNMDSEQMFMFLRGIHPSSDHAFVVERFVLSGGNKFTADLTAAEISGAIKLKIPQDKLVWQLRADKVLISDQWQKDNGYWLTGKRVNWTDGRDVNDAIKHILVWLLRNDHRPTIEMINPRGT